MGSNFELFIFLLFFLINSFLRVLPFGTILLVLYQLSLTLLIVSVNMGDHPLSANVIGHRDIGLFIFIIFLSTVSLVLRLETIILKRNQLQLDMAI